MLAQVRRSTLHLRQVIFPYSVGTAVMAWANVGCVILHSLAVKAEPIKNEDPCRDLQ